MNNHKTVLGVCSSGGHLQQLLPILDSLRASYSIVLCTFKKRDAEEVAGYIETHYLRFPTNRNVQNNLRNLFKGILIFSKFRPGIVISTGAASAVPFALLSLLFRVPFIYVEPIDRVNLPTLTAKILRFLDVHFVVFWDSQLINFPNRQVVP